MRIGCVGAGHIGQAIANVALKAGHQAMLSNSREPESLRDIAAEIGCTVSTLEEAVAFAEVWRFERARPAYCIPMHEARLKTTLAHTTRGTFVPEASWRR